MRIAERKPPRVFRACRDPVVDLAHVADLELADDELITLKTERGYEYDIARKEWGYYATPSLNGRLKDHHLRACLTEGHGKRFVLLVEEDRLEAFDVYLKANQMRVLYWLDGAEVLTPPA